MKLPYFCSKASTFLFRLIRLSNHNLVKTRPICLFISKQPSSLNTSNRFYAISVSSIDFHLYFTCVQNQKKSDPGKKNVGKCHNGGFFPCEESIARILEAWKRFPDPDSGKNGFLKRKVSFFAFRNKYEKKTIFASKTQFLPESWFAWKNPLGHFPTFFLPGSDFCLIRTHVWR